MITEEHTYDGLVFRKTTFPGLVGGWEVYWGNWVAIGEYNKDQDWEEIKKI